jgi:predicted RNA-binding Zn-ribbon protein involved in translation (DUF1610 family)
MPKKQKINLAKVMASLNTVCPKCGCSIPTEKRVRVDWERLQCPECGERLVPVANVSPRQTIP